MGRRDGVWLVSCAGTATYRRRCQLVGCTRQPFRSFGRTGEGLESLLADQRAGRNEPIAFVLHFVCPRTQYTDRAKSGIVLPGDE